jgi:integrase
VETLADRIPSEASATQFKRIGLLRHFAIFLNNMGYEAYVYPHLYNVNCSSGFSPYIFSHEQISAIISTADSLEYSAQSPKYHIVWPTFVRILYGCGLRLSEALRLPVKDVDLFHGVLYIEKSKKNTSRFVPMSASLMQHCVLYAEQMRFDMNGKGYFFPAPDNGRYGINTARSLIKKLYALAGILPMSNGRLPRIHDIRHTFSCHSLEKMQGQGVDLYYSLPILSNYLGHQGIRDTERYLRLAIFKFPSIVEMQRTAWDSIIPEVTIDEDQ